MRRIQYWIGKHSKKFRKWYIQKHDGSYLWGLIQFLIDDLGEFLEYDSSYDNITQKDLDEFLEVVFS